MPYRNIVLFKEGRIIVCYFFIAECDVETLAAEIEDGIFSNQL